MLDSSIPASLAVERSGQSPRPRCTSNPTRPCRRRRVARPHRGSSVEPWLVTTKSRPILDRPSLPPVPPRGEVARTLAWDLRLVPGDEVCDLFYLERSEPPRPTRAWSWITVRTRR